MSDIEKISDDLLGFLPVAVAERLAPSLTHSDVETLQYLFIQSIPENTLRAIASDLGYLEAWHLEATGTHLPWPARQDTILKFIAHHLFNLEEQRKNKAHGMPAEVAAALHRRGVLKAHLPHAPSTVKRRLSHWRKLHDVRGLDDAFGNKAVCVAVNAAVRASSHLKTKKSKKPITIDIIGKLSATCDPHRLTDRRDKALLLVAFGSGGRRRSEMCALKIEDITIVEHNAENHRASEKRRGQIYEIRLRTAKRICAGDNEKIYIASTAARALDDWLRALRKIKGDDVTGPIFRSINKWGDVQSKALTPQSVNTILKNRLEKAGFDPTEYSAHGIRAGFLTEARNRHIPLEQAMRHSKHRSYQVASQYYQNIDDAESEVLILLD